MERSASESLDRWLDQQERQPLVVRGARQVGKTWLVRDLAARRGLDLVECNFERDPTLARAFEDSEPQRILGELGLRVGRRIDASTALLFLDEIQAAPAALASLRWFAEELPALPVIAAGSLLDFALADHTFSMPVGRITYLYLQPMDFPEFLRAHGQAHLVEAQAEWTWAEKPSEALLASTTTWLNRYAMVGGMPAVVRADAGGADALTVRKRQRDLLTTYLDDFAKYTGRADPGLLDSTLRSIARQLGGKFVYTRVEEGVRSDRARRALELLSRARVCTIVKRSNANGLPLGGEVNERSRKVLLLDIGLAHALFGTPADRVFPSWDALAPAVRGSLMEQITGQQLLALAPPSEDARLHYWQRGSGRAGEVDFLAQVDMSIVPVEVKSGEAGGLKSLHQFMHDKDLDLAVRCDAGPPSLQHVDLRTTQGDPVSYRLLTTPHGLVWRVPDAVREAQARRRS